MEKEKLKELFAKSRLKKQIQFSEELIEANKAIESFGTYSDYSKRAYIYKSMMNYDDADKDYAKAVKLIEEEHFLDSDYYKLICDAYNKKAESQIRFLSELEKVSEHENHEKLRLSIILDLTKAIESLREIKTSFTNNEIEKVVRMLFERAKLKFSNNDFSGTISDLTESDKYLKMKIYFKDRLKLIAESYLEIKDFQNALLYSDVITQKTDRWSDFEFTAEIKERMGDIEGAIKDYSSAIEIDGYTYVIPGYASSYFENNSKGNQLVKRGVLKEKMGQKEDAFQDYISAYKIDKTVVSRNKSLFTNVELRQFLKDNHYI